MATLKTFPNGLKMVYNKMDCYSVSIGVFVRTGSLNETDAENGISHFIEHMTFKGTEKRTAFGIADEIESIGAQINAYTSKECTAYYTVSLTEHAEKCADILSDIFFNSTFPEHEIKREQGVVIEEINMYEDMPEDVCIEQLSTAYYGDHPLGKTILGPKENILTFDKQMILDYKSRRYTADNVIISIAGAISCEEAERLVQQYFESMFGNSSAVGRTDFARRESVPTFLSKKKDTEQAHLAIVFPGPEYGCDLEAAQPILNGALGGGMSSRLFQKIREELGLAYSVYSYPTSYTFDGNLCIYLGTTPGKTMDALRAVCEEISKLKKDGLIEAELLRSRAQIKSAYLMSNESSRAMMNLYGKNLLLTGKVLDIDAKIAGIEATDLDAVQKLIDWTFDFDRVCVSYVGPEEQLPVMEVLRGE